MCFPSTWTVTEQRNRDIVIDETPADASAEGNICIRLHSTRDMDSLIYESGLCEYLRALHVYLHTVARGGAPAEWFASRNRIRWDEPRGEMGSEGGIAFDNVKRCSMWSTEMQLIDFPVSNAGVWDSHGREDASPEVDFTNVHFKATVVFISILKN